MSKVSIIIPTKNRVVFLLETLNNLFSQSRIPNEIIIVDDHSDDSMEEMVRASFGDKVIVIHSDQPGPGAARNKGFAKASGDFIKFLDSDDLLTKNCIEDQLNILEDQYCDAVYSSYFKATRMENGQWEQKDVIMHFHPIPKGKSIRHLMIRGFFIPIPTFMFRRELLVKAGPWNEAIVAYEDFDLLWRLTKVSESFCHSNQSAMLYRIHGQQTTEDNFTTANRVNDRLICLTPLLREIENDSSFSWFEKELIRLDYRKQLEFLKQFNKPDKQIPYNNFLNKSVEFVARVINKIERIKTGTDWGPDYQPDASKALFDSYLKIMEDNRNHINTDLI
jgi:glycosyltransferase involved in cell wall biosynthesis